jgi:transcriptional regulator with PAS, ATPase and Fis domain
MVDDQTLVKYLPHGGISSELPVLYQGADANKINERELLYKVLFDMKRDMNDLKQIVMDLMKNGKDSSLTAESNHLIQRLWREDEHARREAEPIIMHTPDKSFEEPLQEPEEVEESLSLEKKEMDLIRKALLKHDGKRKEAARDLGISERTLYRKIKEYELE